MNMYPIFIAHADNQCKMKNILKVTIATLVYLVSVLLEYIDLGYSSTLYVLAQSVSLHN